MQHTSMWCAHTHKKRARAVPQGCCAPLTHLLATAVVVGFLVLAAVAYKVLHSSHLLRFSYLQNLANMRKRLKVRRKRGEGKRSRRAQ